MSEPANSDWVLDLIAEIETDPGAVVLHQCGDVTGPHQAGGPCVMPKDHPHLDGIGGEWPITRGMAEFQIDHRVKDMAREMVKAKTDLGRAQSEIAWLQGEIERLQDALREAGSS